MRMPKILVCLPRAPLDRLLNVWTWVRLRNDRSWLTSRVHLNFVVRVQVDNFFTWITGYLLNCAWLERWSAFLLFSGCLIHVARPLHVVKLVGVQRCFPRLVRFRRALLGNASSHTSSRGLNGWSLLVVGEWTALRLIPLNTVVIRWIVFWVVSCRYSFLWLSFQLANPSLLQLHLALLRVSRGVFFSTFRCLSLLQYPPRPNKNLPRSWF